MSQGERIPLEQAERIGRHLVELMGPGCERIEVVGSTRRKTATVGDLELVVIPRWAERESGQQLALFGAARERYNVLHDMLSSASRCPVCRALSTDPPGEVCGSCGRCDLEPFGVQPVRRSTEGPLPDPRWPEKATARQWTLHLPRVGVYVDLYLATPETWGLCRMIRTGSGADRSGDPKRGFSSGMLARWKQVSRGGCSNECRLYDREGKLVETPEEEDVFRVCQVPWIPPEERVDSDVIRRYAGRVAA